MRILVDSNVLLRLASPSHPHQLVAKAAVRSLETADHDLVVVPQNYYEFWVVATRPLANNGLGLMPPQASGRISIFKLLFSLLRDEPAIYDIWEQLVSSLGVQGKQGHDARLAAAMQSHGLTHILTFNIADFTRYRAVTAISPFDVVSGTAAI